MRTRSHILAATAALVIALAGVAGGLFATADTGEASETINIDIAENGFRFVTDETPGLAANGMPKHGTEFITLGYIYPAGTLNGTNGVNADGSPEFPAQVLGTWICRGWFLPGSETLEGSIVVTTQTFTFGTEPGARTIVSDGIERMDIGVPFKRAIVGGTGKKYENAHGEQTQTFLGLQPEDRAFGINIRVELKVR